jgi:hypothetical protein
MRQNKKVGLLAPNSAKILMVFEESENILFFVQRSNKNNRILSPIKIW